MFLKETLDSMEKQDETVTIVTDGVYSGTQNEELAAEKMYALSPQTLQGGKPRTSWMILNSAKMAGKSSNAPAGRNRKAAAITREPGSVPFLSRRASARTAHIKGSVTKMFKRVSRKTVTSKSNQRAKQQRERSTEEFKKQSRFRNGVETIPSILRRKYGIAKIPVRGLIRSSFFLGCKIGALNIQKFCRYMQDQDKWALKMATA